MGFPDRLQALRRERHLTQVALAKAAHVHVSQLRRYEAGIAQPTLETIVDLCKALGVSSDLLVFGSDVLEESKDELKRAFLKVEALDEVDKGHVMALLEAFLMAKLAKDEEAAPRAVRSDRKSPKDPKRKNKLRVKKMR